jgi:tetratricopeptide (TPR) repeat protein
LDWIVMKALEKDRNRRYETASGFAADVQRYLHDEPVQACPPSVSYRFRKFVWRNKAWLAATACVLAVVFGLTGSAVWFALQRVVHQAETEKVVTTALAQAEVFLTEGDKEIDHPERWQAKALLAQAALEKAAELLAAGAGTEELADWVQQVRAAVEAAVTDSRLLIELERVQQERGEIKEGHRDFASKRARYAALLRGYGVDLAMPEEAVARVRQSRVRLALLAALEDWWRESQYLVSGGPEAVRAQHEEWVQVEEVRKRAEPTPDAFHARWRAAYLQQDSTTKAQTLARLANEPGVQNLPVMDLVNLAHDLFLAGENAAAERLLKAGLERDRGNFRLNHGLGMLYFDRFDQFPGGIHKAVTYLTAALALRNDDAGVCLRLGIALDRNNDREGAISEYRAALQINPDDCDAHFELGNALLGKNDVEGAIRECRKAIQLAPKHHSAHYVLGGALARKKDLEGAIREYRVCLQIHPTNWALLPRLGLGDALLSKNDVEGAIREYRAALQVDPNSIRAHTNLGFALLDKNDVEGALCEGRAALQINSNYKEAHLLLGDVLLKKKDLEGAIREYRAALQIDPNFAHAHFELGDALLGKNDVEGAIGEFRAALRIDPNWAAAHSHLGFALYHKKDFEGAIRENLAALQIDPSFEDGRYNAACAAALAGCGQDKDADKFNETARASLRRQALDWLRDDLEKWDRLLDKEPDKARAAAKVTNKLRHWLADPDFAGVRGPEAIAKLPAAERQTWQELWGHVADTLARAQAKTTPEKKPDQK